MRLSNLKMKPKLILILVLAVLLPLVVSSVFTYRLVSSALMEKSYDQLTSIREIKKQQVKSFFNERLGDVQVLANSPNTVEAFIEMDRIFKNEGGHNGNFRGNTNESYDAPPLYKEVHDYYFPVFKYYIEKYGYYDLFLMDAENGDISFTVTKEADFAQRTGSIESSLRDVWRKAKQGQTALSDTKPYSPSAGAPALFVASPLKQDGKIIGVVALQISIDAINAIMQERSGLGETGETYLVGSDMLMRSDSFLDPANHTVEASFANPSKGKVETAGARNALNGKSAKEIIIDYNGNPVLSVYSPVDIGSITWALLAEIDEAEVRKPIHTFLLWTLAIAVCLLTLSAIAAFFIAGQIATPLAKNAAMARAISDGDLTQQVDVDQEDEVGQLSKSLNEMSRGLRDMFTEITGGVNTLTFSSTALSAISTQMSSSADDTSTMANSVATAAEEMSSNMDSVAAASEEAATNVNMVAAAAEEMTSTISEIAESTSRANIATTQAAIQASTAAERVDELGKAAQEISKMTQTITEISEQTNLLALNATIEAARAGEAGKGFAVVANEIKDLAKQTSEATKEIKDKISAVQVSTNATIEQINQVNEMVQEAKEMTETVASAIEEQSATTLEISNNVNQASKGIQEVTENVSQSSVVADEVARDITKIDNASNELQQKSGQVNESSEELSQLADNLSGMMRQYKV